jgi:hypothetical protein
MAVFYTGGHSMGLSTLGNVVDGGLGGLSDWTRHTYDYTRAVEAVWCCSLQGWLFYGGPP